jgi:hypothetical protein
VKEIPVRTETVVRERLVKVEIPADSAVLSALLECDSMNNVRLVEIGELKSSRVESVFNLTPNDLKQSILNYKTKTVHDTVFVPAKDSIVTKDRPVLVEIPVEVNTLTGWQWFQIWTGRIFLSICIIIIIIYLAFKFFKKI